MVRFSWSCLALSAFLLAGCSSLGILQDSSALSTPTTGQTQPRRQAVAQPAPPSARQVAVAQQPVVPPKPASVKVAVLVPLSGKSAPLGQAMVNAAQLAVFDMGVNGFELMPRDTKGTADGAVQATQEAIASGAQLLIGPLFAADVAAVKPTLSSGNVSMLALSTDVSLAAPGAYVMGFAPAPQVDRVVAFAISRGIRSFAALIPAGPYGQLVSKAFTKAVNDHGGSIVISESSTNAAALAAHKDKIEAIFAPLGGAELRKVAAQLTTAGFETGRVRMIGTGLWDETDLAKDQTLLLGGWFAAPEPESRIRFVQSYKDTYNQEPPRLATLAYDATALAAVLARNGARYDGGSLTVPSGFAGLDGIFRLQPNGQIERGLAVLEVGNGQNSIVDPSPSTFVGR